MLALAIVFLIFIAALAWVLVPLYPYYCEAVALNLTHEGPPMAKIGDSFTARISPSNAAGLPAPVFSVVWDELGEAYNVSAAPDGMSAVFTAVAAGVGNSVAVSATTKGGTYLSDSLDLPDVVVAVDEEATDLNVALDT